AGALARAGIDAELVDAACVLHTDGRAGDAAPDLARTERAAQAQLLPLLARGRTVVVPGFIGAAPDGRIVTLGRGGTDFSATILGRALGAAEVSLWKDVPGCMTADPRLVPDARVVQALDPREASELACYGAKVLHPRALLPLDARTVLRIRPFGDPEAPGTIVAHGRGNGGSPVRALTAMLDQALVTVGGGGMLGVPGIAARAFSALASAGISVSMISQASSEHSICFTVPGALATEAVQRLRLAFALEIGRGEVDDVSLVAGLATIAVVGSGMARTPGIAARIFGAVAASKVNVVAIAQGASERNVTFVVREEQAPEALRAVHAAFRLGKVGGGRVAGRHEGLDVVVLGLGRIGRELIAQLVAQDRVLGRGGPRVRVVGVIDRSGCVFEQRGLTARRLEQLARHKERGGQLCGVAGARCVDAREAVEFIASHALHRPVLVDVASGDTRPALLAALSHDMDLVLANKVPLASDAFSARALLHDARARGRRVLHEATVGAGLPVIDTLQQLVASGDRVLSVEGCPSGTMGFLFGELGRGIPFSEAVRAAMAAGYTEPDPRDDLCGLDVARKGLILGRLLGYAGELTDLAVESLVPETLRDCSVDAFLAALPSLDAEWKARVDDARGRGEVLRYRVRATRGGVRVGLVGAPLGGSLASLEGTDNIFVFTTARYRERPLVVSGPGAGAAVTAAGVLGDLLRMVAA
ncbi:MAG TPA: aspartate kinase, partial [Gemmatimonadaceae bacterium]|nr:aspartate kinase [Gemmatimonadaceae bacterium]